jgi:hypothetical protein
MSGNAHGGGSYMHTQERTGHEGQRTPYESIILAIDQLNAQILVL